MMEKNTEKKTKANETKILPGRRVEQARGSSCDVPGSVQKTK